MPLIWECRPESRFQSFDITLSTGRLTAFGECTINQNGKRKVVVAIRERGGRALTLVFKSELASTTTFFGPVLLAGPS